MAEVVRSKLGHHLVIARLIDSLSVLTYAVHCTVT